MIDQSHHEPSAFIERNYRATLQSYANLKTAVTLSVIIASGFDNRNPLRKRRMVRRRKGAED
jgi:hypothetical protein